MNIELTTDNLRKSCRVCLNQGELDIWEHTISFQDDENCESARNSQLSALELFKIYEDCDDALLGLNDELKLLCFSCLDELTNSYLLYKKVAQTNKQIQRLYKEAQKIEADQLVEVDYIEVLENVENEDSNDTNLDVLESQTSEQGFELVDETETEVALEDYIEQITYVEEERHVESKPAEPETDTETTNQTESVVNSKSTTNTNACDNDIIEESFLETPNDICSNEIKPAIMKETHSKSQRDRITRSSGPSLPPHKDGSLVVTQFLPSTAHIVLDASNPVTAKGEDEDLGVQAADLSTVDFAAVEVKSSNLQQIIEEELQLQNTKPPSPESVDSLDMYGNKQVRESSNTVYICKFCPQAFSAPHYLIAHVRKSHVCKYCTQAFAKSMDLFVHIRQAHHQHKCAICNKELSSHSNLRGHIKRVHGIRLPAQVALLDYRPPNSNAKEKPYSSTAVDSTLDEMDMYF